jgi:hypothetical protein
VYWEFTSILEKIISNILYDRLKVIYERHRELQHQEQDADKEVKLDARIKINKFLSIVVDEMD